MSLDKAIEHGKEKRKQYTGGKLFAASCRNHGWCEWCRGNRQHKFRDKKPHLEETEQEEYDDKGIHDKQGWQDRIDEG